MTTSLKTAWKLWEKAEKGWESGKPADKPEVYKTPDGKKKEEPYERPEITVTRKETPSFIATLEDNEEFVPGNDKDAKVMQLKTELAKLEEALMEFELDDTEVDEAFMTPDVGTNIMGGPMGVALQPPNGYARNDCPDAPAPEEQGQDLDRSNTLVSPRQFMPSESSAIYEWIARNHRVRLAKLQGR